MKPGDKTDSHVPPGGARLLLFFVAGLALPALAFGAAEERRLAETLRAAALEYNRKLEDATTELRAMRARIAAERVPLEETVRATEDEVLALEASLALGETTRVRAESRKKEMRAELDALNRNHAYITSLARDAVEALNDGLLPGEAAVLAERLQPLWERLQDPANQHEATLAVQAGELITARLRQAIGGALAPGACLRASDNEVVAGTFAWLGPEAFFLAQDETIAGPVHIREGTPLPVVSPLPAREAGEVAALFRGERGLAFLDASGGKALRLEEVRGTWLDHIRRGGVIGYVIIALGAVAAFTTILKISDLRLMAIDSPEVVRRVLVEVESGATSEAERLVVSLAPSLRELFQAGLMHLDKPKGVLEDHLYAALLRQRMRLERRLPFLTVIVAAAPLLGLLGTVTGMIKTFTLINVFGTGNAAKLSSGISEALVTTEFGLMVAIPTLVVHGYLNRRTQRNLAQMERYAAEFVAAAAERRVFAPAPASELP